VAHNEHSALPHDGATLPGEHAVGATLPVAQLEPGGHSRHCSAAARSVPFE
jgi:hypothetical protein